jgi:hypothetical protein
VINKYTESDKIFYLKSIKTFPYTDEDMLNNEITKKDKEFLHYLLKDDVSSFDLIYNDTIKNTKISAFYSSQRYLPEVNFQKNNKKR